jgi:hypothetical protein
VAGVTSSTDFPLSVLWPVSGWPIRPLTSVPLPNNPADAITGFYIDANGVYHGFLRTPDGTFTTFDAPGAGTKTGQGTSSASINPEGAIAGDYADASNVNHGFLRAPDGTFTTFDAPGAGTGSGQGTTPFNNNPADAITGFYIDASGVSHGFLRTPCDLESLR